MAIKKSLDLGFGVPVDHLEIQDVRLNGNGQLHVNFQVWASKKKKDEGARPVPQRHSVTLRRDQYENYYDTEGNLHESGVDKGTGSLLDMVENILTQVGELKGATRV